MADRPNLLAFLRLQIGNGDWVQSDGLPKAGACIDRDQNFVGQAVRKAGAPQPLSLGYNALKAEGQAVWFRDIEFKSLEK